MTKLKIFSVLITCLFMLGCPNDNEPETSAGALNDWLRERKTLQISPSDSTIGFSANDHDHNNLNTTLPTFVEGTITLRIDENDRLLVEALKVDLSNFIVETPSMNYTFGDNQIRLGTQLNTSPIWPTDFKTYGAGNADLLMDSAIKLSDATLPIPISKLESAEMSITVDQEQNSSNVTVMLSASFPGVFIDVYGVHLEQLSFQIVANTTIE